MTDNRSVTIGHDADGNVIITGDGNRVYVFPGITELSAEFIARLEKGENPENIGAVPRPTLILTVVFADDDSGIWQIRSSYPADREGEPASWSQPLPWQTEPEFARSLDIFWRLSRKITEKDEQQALAHSAHILGEALANVLDGRARTTLIEQSRSNGPPPMLIIASDHDFILALPWELLRLEDRFAVRDGRLDIARSIASGKIPELTLPEKPVTLSMTVAAPEGSGLNYEEESYHVTRALHDHVGVVVNEMGELADLIAGLSHDPAPVGLHFSGHGGPGTLLFENDEGEKREVTVDELITKIRQSPAAQFPKFLYLACCHGGTPPSLGQNNAIESEGITSTAAQLHRDGVTQVVGYFGPVYDVLSTQAEAAFYREIGRGRRTRDALRAARAVMAKPFMPQQREVMRDSGSEQHHATPFAWAQLVLYHSGPDYPLGTPVSQRFADAADAAPA